MKPPVSLSRSRLLLLLPLLLAGMACSLSLLDLGGEESTPRPPLTSQANEPTTLIPLVEVTFRLTIPENTPPFEAIQLSLLDEVTGLALNPQRYPMQEEGDHLYSFTLPLQPGRVIKYRYTRKGDPSAEEHTADGRPVRYRLYHVVGPGIVEDVVSRWNDTPFTGDQGRISGVITDASNGVPIPNLLVTAGGMQTLTAWDGSYLLEGLPPATHNLVAYALDGSYQTYQQGAVVAPNATTPASLQLSPTSTVNVTFNVKVPEDTIPGVPVRLAGNLFQLGNTFASLSGGISAPAYRLPVLRFVGEGRYTLTLPLPVGAHVRYKYTLGDGFWNAEHDEEGRFRLRDLIVPDNDLTLEEQVTTWRAGNSAPIWFEVSVPQDTPPADSVSIQFHPFGWTPPIPMWRLAENRWSYLLASPLDMLPSIGYRYCRNEQCGSADDERTAGTESFGRPVSTSLIFQNIQDEVKQWSWMAPFNGVLPTPPTPEEIPTRPHFLTGIEFQPGYDPSWIPHLSDTFSHLRSLGASWVIQTPTWSFTRRQPPVLEPLTGTDIPWPDQVTAISQAQDYGLSIALFPTVQFPQEPDLWWQEAPRDAAWWSVWFERYHTFVMHHAGLAERNQVQTLILGGPWLNPALPDGFLADGFSSGVPPDALDRWRALIADVRAIYNGTLAWALPYPQGVQNPPPFLDSFDQIYLLWSAPLSTDPDASAEALRQQAAHLLDTVVYPLTLQFDQPLILSAAYPSADGGITGCLGTSSSGCLNFSALSRPNPDIPEVERDLQEQAEVYNALLDVASQRAWIRGFVSRGFYPPVSLRDKSLSIHGKPAEQIVAYWFTHLRGEQP